MSCVAVVNGPPAVRRLPACASASAPASGHVIAKEGDELAGVSATAQRERVEHASVPMAAALVHGDHVVSYCKSHANATCDLLSVVHKCSLFDSLRSPIQVKRETQYGTTRCSSHLRPRCGAQCNTLSP